MSKRTLTLIGILIIVAAALVAIAVSPKRVNLPSVITTPFAPSPTPFAQTVMTMSPAAISVASGATGTVSVNIDSGINAVTAVQLDMTYDPKALTNIKITAGPFFQNPFELLNIIDTKTGKISYALGLPPSAAAKKGNGTVATISFTPLLPAGQTTQLTFTNKSLATAEGVSKSVLKSSSGATITVTQATFVPQTNQTAPAVPAQ